MRTGAFCLSMGAPFGKIAYSEINCLIWASIWLSRYKNYMNKLDDGLYTAKADALAANLEVFSDEQNLQKIARYIKTGQFPWE